MQLERPYLLVLNVPYFEDEDGSIYLENLWHHDFVRHLSYLPQLVCACPRLPLPADTNGLVKFEGDRKHFFALPAQESTGESLRNIPRLAALMFRAVGVADVVHTGVSGWPYPIGWWGVIFARLRGKALVINVESATWRTIVSPPSAKARVRARIFEVVNAWACRGADIALYTQPSYRESLHRGARGAAYVTPATWIQGEDIIPTKEAQRRWRARSAEPVRLLYAGRLLEEKGVGVLLDALEQLDAQGVSLALDFIGSGELEATLDARLSNLRNIEARRLAPVPYGKLFFELLEGYHALVVPSLGDEQPRILFDAAARGVSVIASATDGIRPYVHDDETGRLVPPGDVAALTSTLAACAQDPACLRRYGLAALTHARSLTHEAMHASRSQLLANHFSPAVR